MSSPNDMGVSGLYMQCTHTVHTLADGLPSAAAGGPYRGPGKGKRLVRYGGH